MPRCPRAASRERQGPPGARRGNAAVHPGPFRGRRAPQGFSGSQGPPSRKRTWRKGQLLGANCSPARSYLPHGPRDTTFAIICIISLRQAPLRGACSEQSAPLLPFARPRQRHMHCGMAGLLGSGRSNTCLRVTCRGGRHLKHSLTRHATIRPK